MKISTLQSLIDRTSNQIAEYEASVELCKMSFSICTNDLEVQQNLFEMRYYKSRLPKLREIQKDLKKEIADKVRRSGLTEMSDDEILLQNWGMTPKQFNWFNEGLDHHPNDLDGCKYELGTEAYAFFEEGWWYAENE